MKILVIGNGFDLEHGLPTKYKDFLDFMQGINLLKENTNVITKEYFSYELEKKVNHKVDDNVKNYFGDKNLLNFSVFNKWAEEEISKELIECANNNLWIRYFIDNMNYEKEGWIDLESEISNVIQCFDYAKNLSNYLKKFNEWPLDRDREKYKEIILEKIIEYSGLNLKFFELIDKNLKQLIDNSNEHLNSLIRCLEIYLEECINKIDVEFNASDIKENPCDKVLNFNYTYTHHRLYDIYPTNPKEYDYIHGNADINRNATENNMVLGIDEYLDGESKDRELEFIAFKKYFQRIYKKTGNTYKKWILEMKSFEYESTGECDELGQFETQKIKNEIYIFGHSLDVTDKDIIKELIECPNTVTTIFYYNKEVYAQQITNLVKVIGQDKLIKRVSGANPTIIFKEQSKRIKRNI